jgi:hypothetical protein
MAGTQLNIQTTSIRATNLRLNDGILNTIRTLPDGAASTFLL